MYYVRGSELNDFLRCRLRWKYAWVDGLKAKKPNVKLETGTLMHRWLEAWYNSGLDNGAAWNAMIKLHKENLNFERMDPVELDDMETLLEHMTKNYATKYGKYEIDGQWEVIATELTFAIPLDDEIGYTGTIDMVVRSKADGKIYFLDTKTTSSIDKYDKASDMDRQISRYWWALQQLQQGNGQVLNQKYDTWSDISQIRLWDDLKGEIGGFIYNIVLKDFPVPPKVLKNGTLSKDKSQKTTVGLYCEAIEDNGLDYDDYQDILDHLSDNPKEFFRRLPVHRNQAEIDASIQELYHVGKELHSIKSEHEQNLRLSGGTKGSAWIYRNITHDCTWDCPFVDVCKASMDGSNVDYLVDSLFVKDESRSQ